MYENRINTYDIYILQYKRDDGIYDNHHNNINNIPNNNINNNNINNNQLAYFNNRYERRLSVESARTLSDSSSDTEGEKNSAGKNLIYVKIFLSSQFIIIKKANDVVT